MSASAAQSQIPNVLSIAGIDPSGGAGIYADLKAFAAAGAYGCGVVAALTAQNTQGVAGVHVPPTDFLRLQIDTLFADVAIHATKIGMLGSAEVTAAVADRLAHWQAVNVVLDPVMVAKSGDALLAKSAISMMREALFPQAFMITPNLPEAGVLLESSAPETVKEMYRAAERLRELLPLSSERWVLLKGGHLPGNELTDLLFDGDRMIELPAPRIDTRNTHGTGCTLSSAIAALLPQRQKALHPVEAAVRDARQWLLGAIARAGELAVGSGHGPVHHFHALWPR
ncbi:bifunctional hydroxymethylpyrimidine kinase/phosphomethylpyrimidine kinase [Thauera sp. CAU 1555]|uniref:hydroxymethylpyrimidine kinase n=1 Tax=Thauera sedimentorum TaxID=2767595 RepID=A0ABR9B7Y4_9RHOO|nr:bifunctional hydroxymethylpyrimidine kinase/phosphomethylpyrimidine kinase [Thauera sedimentorum]MBC9070356.1 bifunctional hydroxymethylpyrimidine kinase/phosphomethylpyrimidine kinase [Thauera sedimentorum]MBD8501276.1 bifunctional hydroxymethylpyrimidine kinase/phosphomethylpyrimidine kinase [Thauera sedimentorum]